MYREQSHYCEFLFYLKVDKVASMKTLMSGHFYELPSVFPAAGTTFPIQSMYSLLPSSMEVVMTSHTSYGWFSAVGMQFILVPYTIKCYCCHTFHKLCQLRHPDCSCFDHHQNLGIVFYLPLPLVHTRDPWHEKIDTFKSITQFCCSPGMMLTQAASLLDTSPPAICLATSLLGAVTKAMEKSSGCLLAAAIPVTEYSLDLVTLGTRFQAWRRICGINTSRVTVIYTLFSRYI